MKRNILTLGVLTAMLALQPGPAPAATPADPVVIPVVVSSTGPAAQAGKEFVDGVTLYGQFANKNGGINGRPVRFDFLDDGTDPRVAVQLFSQLAAKHPAVVLGSGTVGTCAAVGPLVESTPMVQYCFSPGYLPKANSYAFAASVSVTIVLPVLLKYALARGWKRIAMLTSTDATGILTDKLLPDMIKARADQGMVLVGNEHFNPADIGVAAQVARIKALDPQAIYTAAAGPVFGNLLRALHDAGLSVPVITSTVNMNYDQMNSYKNILPSELLFNGFAYELSTSRLSRQLKKPIGDFLDTFRAAGIRPTPLSIDGWDAAQLMVSALRKVGPDADATAVHTYLENLSGFAGATGIYDMRLGDQHGLNEQSVVVVRWDPLAGDWTAVSEPGGKPL